ncbi:AAA-like domain-containing protein [Accumulibacter sp.]|uniref:AAA-like domain-containing protein n=1 Tax=Accumulibacter sp. TaxID=2053492 RepID=UPI00260A7529|nr:AAA-like domain-containing protein [Accumulibacter sp.]
MATIFISYKRGTELDEPLAGELYRRLSAAGHQVFRDQDSLIVGQPWARAIQAHLESCDYLVLLLSAAAAASEMVAEEVRLARRAQAARGIVDGILPVRVAFAGELPYHLGAALSGIQHATWSGQPDTEHLAAALLDAMAQGGPGAGDDVWRRSPAIPPAGPADAAAGRPAAACNPIAPLEQAGAAMPDSPYYVERHADTLAARECRAHAFTLVIRGPRQVGKSSLLGRILGDARRGEQAVVAIDLQRFADATRADADTLLREFCAEIEYQLQLPSNVDDFWETHARRDPGTRATRYLEREVLPALGGRKLVVGLDECDTLLDQPGGRLFFPLLRSWVNQARGKNPPHWAPFNLMMVVGTEPAMLISDLNQSPFNVGTTIEIDDFDQREVDALQARYGAPIAAAADRARFYELLRGHPFLTRLALNQIAEGRWRYPAEDGNADSESGIFGDHLRTLLARVNFAGLGEALRRLLAGQPAPDDHRRRLLEGGLIVERQGRIAARNGLYGRYFGRVLNA